jgi:hypothetical protein
VGDETWGGTRATRALGPARDAYLQEARPVALRSQAAGTTQSFPLDQGVGLLLADALTRGAESLLMNRSTFRQLAREAQERERMIPGPPRGDSQVQTLHGVKVIPSDHLPEGEVFMVSHRGMERLSAPSSHSPPPSEVRSRPSLQVSEEVQRLVARGGSFGDELERHLVAESRRYQDALEAEVLRGLGVPRRFLYPGAADTSSLYLGEEEPWEPQGAGLTQSFSSTYSTQSASTAPALTLQELERTIRDLGIRRR